MKTTTLRLMAIILVGFIIAISCEKTNNTPANNEFTNQYSGAGSYGDLITFNVNQIDQTYMVTNETTGLKDQGSYEVLEGEFSGIYKIKVNESTFYAVELSDKIIAANFPTGNTNNDISFGISKTIDNTNNSFIPGDYVWVAMNSGDAGDLYADTETGLFTLFDDGSWIAGEFDSAPNDYSRIEPSMSGNWQVDEIDKEKINLSFENVLLTGYAYATTSAGIVLIDLGYGNGFLLGYKVMPSTIVDIEGNYKFIDVDGDGSKGAGSYTITSTGEVTYSHIDTNGDELTGSFDNLTPFKVLKNVYLAEDAEVNGEVVDVYLVIIDEFIMHFCVDEDGLNSYGAGARL